MNATVKRAEQICQQAGLETRREELADAHFSIGIPNGRYTRWIPAHDIEAEAIVSAGTLPRLIALGDYDALLNINSLEIEAAVRSPTPMGPSSVLRLRHLPGVQRAVPSKLVNEVREPWMLPFAADEDQRWSAAIGSAAEEFSLFTYRGRAGVTLRIGKATSAGHDEALRFLEERASSILFELDLRYGVSLNLSRVPIFLRSARTNAEGHVQYRARRRREISREAPHLPRNRYPEKPLALYWYARSAENMPLLQYLASYQVLEYYFPIYYQRETLDRMKQELLDPRFSPQNDTHLTRLLSLVNPQGKNFSNERDQLRATVRACVSQERLADYLTDEGREQFFSGKQQVKNVARLDQKNKNIDLRDQVANRIYDIRCRIVHTKSEAGDQYPELLLPFSEEAESLGFDIDLIQFLAQRVLIHRATPLRAEDGRP